MRKNNRREERIGLERLNNQDSLMKVLVYNNAHDIVVEFQDAYKTKIHTQWTNFIRGNVKNPYAPSVLGVGIIGLKYNTVNKVKNIKEYDLWYDMLERCYDKKCKEKYPAYKNATCCKEWLNFENFYEWLNSQENFKKWHDEERWCLDKDIIFKGNKIYSPKTCCLVSNRVSCLFTKNDSRRGDYPIGVIYNKKVEKYVARISKMGDNGKYRECLGYYDTPEQAFQAYKKAKESYIKQVAQEEYAKGNITKRCYMAMMNYQVEITD